MNTNFLKYRPGTSSLVFATLIMTIMATANLTEAKAKTTVKAATTDNIIAGGLHADFKIDANGKATYHIPLPVPPGINGQTPQLSLKYTSGQSNSSVGIGWSVNGVSAITRCAPNRTVDGFLAPVNYSASDRFCLNGQRLIMTKGSVYGADKTEYRTEVESWQRIVAHNSTPCGSGPCYFTLTNRLGHTRVYGEKETSGRILVNGESTVRTWPLSSKTDLNKNIIKYSYTTNPLSTGSAGAYYLSSIDYSSNKPATVSANRQVKFAYETRDEMVVKYQGGASIQQTARLSNIQTFVGSNLVQDYRLAYHSGSPSRLKHIKACSSTGDCLTETEFSWTAPITAFDAASTALSDQFGSQEGWSAPGSRYLADVNGDGLSDIVGFGSISTMATWVALSEGATFTAPVQWSSHFVSTSWSASSTPRLMADVNADGRADIVGFGLNGVTVGLSTGTGFTKQPNFAHFDSTSWNVTDNPRVATDVNGDGCADIVGFNAGVHVALADCSGGFSAPHLWTNSTEFTQGWSGSTPRYVVDINGDGMSDLLGFGLSGVKVMLSTGTKPFVKPSWETSDFPHFGRNQGWGSSDLRTIADVNGDGLMDIVGIHANKSSGHKSVQVAINTGAGFLAPVGWSNNFTAVTPIEVTDINGDRMADIVNFDLSGVKVALSDGSAFKKSSTFALPNFGRNQGWGSQTPRKLADINGDGLTDILGFDLQSVKVALVNASQFPNLISNITSGFSGQIAINYEPMSGSVYSDSPASQSVGGLANASIASNAVYPVSGTAVHSGAAEILRGGVRQLVSRYSVSDGTPGASGTNTYKKNLSYSNALVDVGGRGWQGFKTKTHTDQASGTIKVVNFHQTFPLTGQVQSVSKQCTTGNDPLCTTTGMTLHEKHYSYHQTTTATGTGATAPPVYATPKKKTREDYYQYGTYEFSIGSESDYDSWGNLNLHSYLGYVSQTGPDQSSDDNVYTVQQFYPPSGPNSWQLAYLKYKKVSSSKSSSRIKKFRAGKDINLTRLSYHSDGTMNLKHREHWDDTNNVFLSYTYEYDAFGNKTQITDPANNSTTLTYDATYNTYKASKSSPKNKSGVALTTHYSYDPRYGKLAATTGPNGNTHTVCYDGFGRVSKRQVPVPANHSGTAASTNCVTALWTGSINPTPLKVVTVEEREHNMDSSGMYCHVAKSLNNWASSSDSRSFSSQTTCLDGMGRQRKVSTPMNSSGTVVTHTEYDSQHRPTSRELPHFTTNTSPLSVSFKYDAYGRLVQQKTPSGKTGGTPVKKSIVHTVTSKSLKAAITEADGAAHSYEKTLEHKIVNGHPRLHKMTVAQDNNAITLYSHDRLGKRKSITDPLGVNNSVIRDSLGRVASMTNPSTGAVSFSYDDTGVLKSKQDAKGSTTYTFDALGRMQSKTFFDGSAAHFYHDMTAVPITNGLGRLTSAVVTDETGASVSAKSYAYDANGKTISEILILSKSVVEGSKEKTFTTNYQHTPNGHLEQLTYPDGSILNRALNATGELGSLSIGSTTYATYQDYNAHAQPLTTTYGNGLVESRAYWPVGFQDSFKITDSADTDLYHETYDWDELGQIKTITDSVKYDGIDLSQIFGYSSLRLTSATSSGTYGSFAYHYDNGGNLKTLNPDGSNNSITFNYHSNSSTHSAQQMKTGVNAAEADVYSAKYDTVGNITTYVADSDSWAYTYDPQNRLVKASKTSSGTSEAEHADASSATEFGYDARAVRLWKKAPDGSLDIYVNPHYKYSVQANGDVVTSKYLAAGRKPVAAINTKLSDGSSTTNYYHQDYRRNTVATSDGTAATTKLSRRLAYEPFGTVYPVSGSDPIDRKFAGLRLDKETGLYDHGARYLDPALGRFMSADSGLGAKWTRQDAQNRYAYALNAPTVFSDVGGRMACVNVALGAGVGGALLGGGSYVVSLYDSKPEDQPSVGGTILNTSLITADGFGIVGGAVGIFCNMLEKAATRAATNATASTTTSTTTATAAGGTTNTATTAATGSGSASAASEELAQPLLADGAPQLADTPSVTAGQDVEMSTTLFRNNNGSVLRVSRPVLEENESSDEFCLCFTGSTSVATKQGMKPIDSVQAGDRVWAYDHQTSAADLKEVVRRTVVGKPVDQLVKVSVAGTVIEATIEHPFWHSGREEWVPAEQLKTGDELLTRNGEIAKVTAVEIVKGDFKVYNFEVKQHHNYFVSEAEILVHNLSCSGENTGLGESTELGSGDAAASSESVAEAETDAITSAVDATTEAAADTSAVAAAGTTTAAVAGSESTAAAGVIAAAPVEAVAASAAAEAAVEAIEALAIILAF